VSDPPAERDDVAPDGAAISRPRAQSVESGLETPFEATLIRLRVEKPKPENWAKAAPAKIREPARNAAIPILTFENVCFLIYFQISTSSVWLADAAWK
jgi:hypothetical protein